MAYVDPETDITALADTDPVNGTTTCMICQGALVEPVRFDNCCTYARVHPTDEASNDVCALKQYTWHAVSVYTPSSGQCTAGTVSSCSTATAISRYRMQSRPVQCVDCQLAPAYQ